jgi:hypothetical protein
VTGRDSCRAGTDLVKQMENSHTHMFIYTTSVHIYETFAVLYITGLLYINIQEFN